MSKLDWRTVEQVFARWSVEGLHPTTQSRYCSALSKVIDHAKRSGWVRHNPVREARRPKVPAHRPDVPRDIEVRAALRAAEAKDYLLYAYVLGMATIGCRRSELLAVQVADLDLGNAVVTIRASLADGGPGVGIYRKATKRDDWRDVPLTEQMVGVFTELLDVTAGDYRTVASITGNSEETLRRWYDAGPNLAKKKAVVAMARL